jgi:1,4-dihydroxy-6-naphthoate synthase
MTGRLRLFWKDNPDQELRGAAMIKELTLGFSPCPNDTFMFYPLVHGLVDTGGLSYRERLEDVETLNQLALASVLDISKVSYHALGHIRDDYALLRSGSALGRGCGPLLVASDNIDPAELRGKTIAVPGRYTTAMLLLRLYDPELDNFIVMPFNEIMDAVVSGNVDAGLIIHESRFTYQGFGLHQLVDLGEWWEAETGLPIPLGGIVARRSLGIETIAAIECALRAGVGYARSHPDEAARYVGQHAQEMSADVCAAHIGLYVNDFSTDLGEEGERAITCLLGRAVEAGYIKPSALPLFAH